MEDAIRKIVLDAWTNRWTAVKFSVKVRTFITNPSARDLIADLLLREAFIGSTVNDLLLSYLQQLICTQELSLERAIRSAFLFEDILKPITTVHLINFFKSNSHLYFCNVAEDGIVKYCEIIALHFAWIFSLICKVLSKDLERADASTSSIYHMIISTGCDVILSVLQRPCVCLIMRFMKQIAQSDSFYKLQEVIEQMKVLSQDKKPEIVSQISKCVTLCENFETPAMKNVSKSSSFLLAVPSTIIPSLITLETLRNPTRNPQSMIKYLKLYCSVHRLDGAVLVSEILRACVCGITESRGQDRVYWLSFTYIKLPLLLSQAATNHQMFTGHDITAGFEMFLDFDGLLDSAESSLSEPQMLNLLLKEMCRCSVLTTTAENAILDKRNLQRTAPPEQPVQTPSNVREVLFSYEFIDTVVSSLSKVNNGPDIISCGSQLKDNLTKLISSESFLHRVLISAAAGSKLTKLLLQMIRLNELCMQNSHNELAIMLGDLTLLVLAQALSVFSCQVLSQFIPENFSSTAFVSKYLNSLKSVIVNHHSLSSSENLDILLNAMASMEPIAGCLKYSEMTTYLPQAFIELSKAWQLNAVEESRILEIVNETGQVSHTLLLLSAVSLINQAKISSPQLRHKQVSMVTCMSEVLSGDTVRDSMLKLTIAQLLYKSGLSKQAQEEKTQLLCVDPAAVSLIRSIEEVQKKGYLSTGPYRNIAKCMELTEAKWFINYTTSLLFKSIYIDDLAKTLTLLHAISHLSIHALTDTFVSDFLPSLLHKTAKPITLAEPRVKATCQLLSWNLIVLLLQDEERNKIVVEQMMNKIFTLMMSVYKCRGHSQTIYIMQSLIQSILELRKPYSSLLLAKMPVELMSLLMPSDFRLAEIILGRADLTTKNVSRICTSLIQNENSSKPLGSEP